MSENIIRKTVSLPDGTKVPALGQGTWKMGENTVFEKKEEEAIKYGIELGMTLIDSAEMYADGNAETVVGEAIRGLKGIRDKLFLVSKVYPFNADRENTVKSCENSLKRLGTDYLDLYLLHWRGRIPLEETVAAMEKLKKAGRIKRWGVSNFDTSDMEELWGVENGKNCSVNQILYHLGSRGVDYDLLPWCRKKKVAVMAYCPVAQGNSPAFSKMKKSRILSEICESKGITLYQLLLAWCMRDGDVIVIPKSSDKKHIYENYMSQNIVLNTEDLKKIEEEFPKPDRKVFLDIV